MAATHATSIKLDAELKERIDRLAERRQRTPHWLMKQAIESFVEQEEHADDVVAMLDGRLRHMKETGLHVSNEEAQEWLTRLARGERPPPPKPHR
jgi:predicted transcriptional regulator